MTKKKLLIKNALLVDPKNEVEFVGSLLVEKGIIKEIFKRMYKESLRHSLRKLLSNSIRDP